MITMVCMRNNDYIVLSVATLIVIVYLIFTSDHTNDHLYPNQMDCPRVRRIFDAEITD